MPTRTRSPEHTNVNLLDGLSLFAAVEHLGLHHDKRITLNYPALQLCLRDARAQQETSFPPATLSLLFASTDPESEGQSRFIEMLSKSGFVVDASDFRENYRSPAPGTFPSTFRDGRHDDVKPQGSLVARIAFALGLLARHQTPSVVVVSHSFELHAPMAELARRGGKVSLAFFGSLVDNRWKRAGLFEQDSPIQFIDLDMRSLDLLGLDTSERRSTMAAANSGGLSRL